ncbi:MAG: acetyl-CoA decarbonylase/synthase complex subunit gamma [Candidatus Bipolaricaulota bacterium]
MADLSAMDIYQELPQTDCGDCNFPTCMAFAMQLASKQVSLDECPHVTEEAEEALSASSAPPMRIVTVGNGNSEVEVGGETVQFRHEEKFYRPPGIGITVRDGRDRDRLNERVERVNQLQFERVGEEIGVDMITVENSQLPPSEFGELVAEVNDISELPLIILSSDPESIEHALKEVSDGRPLIGKANGENWRKMAELSEKYECPLTVAGEGLEELADLTERISETGVEEMILAPDCESLPNYLQTLTEIRRLAVKEKYSPLGYPVMASTVSDDLFQLVADGTNHVLKFASILTLDTVKKWQILPILTVRQHIYIDPQVQNSVEAKLYEVGDPGPDSPVLFTTNFQLTYYSLEGEVEDGGFSAYITVMDTDGLGVLNSYADDRLSGEGIAETIREQGAMDLVNHDKIIIPGLVAMLRISIQEEGDWEVLVGPEDAASLPRFLRQEWEE